MKKNLFLLLILSALAAWPARAAFVEGLEDIPLPEGIEEIENGSLSFGNEEIRLIETYLSAADKTFDEVCRFYQTTLPQLGWQLKKQNKHRILFEREGETLEVSRESTNPLVIRLTVKSKI